ncbi:hypothetical protein MRX96_014072 [Rhipicephalus microplus]
MIAPLAQDELHYRCGRFPLHLCSSLKLFVRRGQHEHKGHHSQTTPTSALPSLWNAIFAVLALLGACSLCFYCFSLRDGGPTPLGRTSHDRQEFSSTGVGFQPMRTQAAANGICNCLRLPTRTTTLHLTIRTTSHPASSRPLTPVSEDDTP